MLSIRDVWTELAYPFRSLGIVMTVVVLQILLFVASSAGMLGIWLTIVVLPALARYLMMYLESRSRDSEPEVLGIEHFTWTSNFWSLFPVVPFVLLAFVIVPLVQNEQLPHSGVYSGIVMPASLAVLSITHSPLQSINPVAVVGLMIRCRSTYWIAPLVVLLTMLVLPVLDVFPSIVSELLAVFMLLVTFGLIGAVLRPHEVVDDIGVEAVEAGGEEIRKSFSDKERSKSLGHAYGFASRNNLTGALDHLVSAIESDRESDEAWGWYFENMLKWENSFPAMKFAQLYLSYLIGEQRTVDVAKITMRCRIIDDRFKPKTEDLPAVIAALEACGNPELARQLRH